VELDTDAVQGAHEAMAEMGVDGLIAVPQKVGMEHVAHLDEEGVDALRRFAGGQGAARARRDFKGVPSVELPAGLAGRDAAVSKGRLRFPLPPHANQTRRHSRRRHGPGQNAADAGVAGVAQGAQHGKNPKPSLVICPASVLHNWRREAERFTPGLKVLVLESGAARHNLRKQIPQHDIIVTNYALLRRDPGGAAENSPSARSFWTRRSSSRIPARRSRSR
jgi:hypothetical protein